MKYAASAFVLISSLLLASLALAGADDMKWVARCVADNADAKVSVDVVTRYCTCMNNKMSDNETQSITTWEKSHPAERAECDREAGWR
jgi:hypothetical protein